MSAFYSGPILFNIEAMKSEAVSWEMIFADPLPPKRVWMYY
jgi:hypothetical protein